MFNVEIIFKRNYKVRILDKLLRKIFEIFFPTEIQATILLYNIIS